MTETTHRRTFLHFGGYHPIAPDDARLRFARELARFSGAWSIKTVVQPGVDTPEASQWQVTATGAGWRAQTSYSFFRWDDVILRERTRRWASRLTLGLASGADFLRYGAAWGYARNSWRYALFFLYPFLSLAVLAALAFGIASLGLALAMPAPSAWLKWGLAAGLFALALPLVGNRLYLDHLLDDWIHAMRLVRAPDPVVAERIETIVQRLMQAEQDELVIFGHSLGAVHAVELVDRLLALQPEGPTIRFATAGSSILKIGLHGKAHWLRDAIGRIARSRRVIWVEFQALNDVMNFCTCDPVTVLKQQAPPVTLYRVRFRAGVDPARYRRMERNLFRLHNQFVHGNDVRASYDFMMMLAGPFVLEALARSGDGAMSWIAADGGITPAGARQRLEQAPT